MKIVLIGIQGSGKGTQGKILEEKHNFKIFDTGAYIREIAKEDTELGKEIKKYINSGSLIPLEIIHTIINNFLNNQTSNTNIVFDGIPRNLAQKKLFDKIVGDVKIIHLNISKSEAENRIIGRKICFSCQSTYQKSYNYEFCEKCGGKIGIRSDDSDYNTIKNRIDTFITETIPVIEAYKKEGKVIEIDSLQDISSVSEQIENALGLLNLNKN